MIFVLNKKGNFQTYFKLHTVSLLQQNGTTALLAKASDSLLLLKF